VTTTAGVVVVGFAVVVLTPLMAFMAMGDPPPARAPSAAAVADIPPDVLAAYRAAAGPCALPWEVLAAVAKVASDHGRTPNPAGLMGPFPRSPAAAGEPDPVRAAAAFLCGQGATDPARVPAALAAFNPAVDFAQLLAIAATYRDSPVPAPPPTQSNSAGP
jgi:hypothetical protein